MASRQQRRQTRRPKFRHGATSQQQGETRPGVGVDPYGASAVDPTENVLALVDVQKWHASELRESDRIYQNDMRQAQSRFLDAMRECGDQHQKELREVGERHQDKMREAEVRRQNDLAAQKSRTDDKMDEVLTVQVKTTSELISTQLDKVTTALSTQINQLTKTTTDQISTLTKSLTDQFTTGFAVLSDRTSQLEQYRYETAGKSGVADPALEKVLAKLNATVELLSASGSETTGGRNARNAIAGGVHVVSVAAAAVVAIVGFILGHFIH